MNWKVLLVNLVLISSTAYTFAEETKKLNIRPIPKAQEKFILVSSQQLINQDKELDGKNVLFKGEVIGDIMPRGDFVWFNIQEGATAVGIWAPRDMSKVIQLTGDYIHQGDLVEVEGQFFKDDPKLGGEFCIRAASIKIIEPGHKTTHVMNIVKIEIAVILLVGIICLSILRIFVKKKMS